MHAGHDHSHHGHSHAHGHAHGHPGDDDDEEPVSDDEILVLKDLVEVVTGGGKVGNSSDIIRRAKAVKGWTLQSAMRFLQEYAPGLKDDQLGSLLRIIASELKMEDMYDMLKIITEGEMQGMTALTATRKFTPEEEDDEDALGTLVSIFGDGEAALEKLAQFVALWKTRGGLEGDEWLASVAVACLEWFEGTYRDPLLARFLALLTQDWTAEDTEKLLDIVQRADEDHNWTEADVLPFFTVVAASWTPERKKSLLQALATEWGWRVELWDQLYLALYGKKFDPNQEPGLADARMPPLEEVGPASGGGKKKKKNKNKNKKQKAAAAAAAGGPPRGGAGGGPRGKPAAPRGSGPGPARGGPRGKPRGGAVPPPRFPAGHEEDDEDEFDSDDLGSDEEGIDPEILAAAAQDPELMAKMFSMMGGMGFPGFGPGGGGGSESDEEEDEDEIPKGGGRGGRGGGGGGGRGGGGRGGGGPGRRSRPRGGRRG